MKQPSFSQRAGARAVATFALLAFLAPALFASGADAAERTWYFGANVPVMFIDDTETDIAGTSNAPAVGTNPATNTVYTGKADTSYDTGFRLGVVVGYHLRPNLRLEGEVFYGSAQVDKIEYRDLQGTTTPVGATQGAPFSVAGKTPVDDVSGSAEQFGGMVNLWYDFLTDSGYTPFVGFGLGFINVDQSDLDYDAQAIARAVANAQQQGAGDALPAGYAPKPTGDDTALAYQLGAGVSWQVNETTTLQFGYKFQYAPGLEFAGKDTFASVDSETDLQIHLFEVGFRHNF